MVVRVKEVNIKMAKRNALDLKAIQQRRKKMKIAEANKASFSDKSRFQAIKFDKSKGITVSPHQQKFFDKCKEEHGWE